MRMELYQTQIEILERMRWEKPEDEDILSEYISWLKAQMQVNEGIEMDKQNEEEIRKYMSDIDSYINSYVEKGGLKAKILVKECERLVKRNNNADIKNRGKEEKEFGR